MLQRASLGRMPSDRDANEMRARVRLEQMSHPREQHTAQLLLLRAQGEYSHSARVMLVERFR